MNKIVYILTLTINFSDANKMSGNGTSIHGVFENFEDAHKAMITMWGNEIRERNDSDNREYCLDADNFGTTAYIEFYSIATDDFQGYFDYRIREWEVK